jgi:hypothetical protein
MTVLVINHGIIKSISILRVVICTMTPFDVDTLQDCFRLEVKCMLDISYQRSTLPMLDLGRVHYLPHALLPENGTSSLGGGNE